MAERARSPAKRGQGLPDYVKALVEDQVRLERLLTLKQRKRPQSLSDLRPRVVSPGGRNGMDQVIGQWAGEETDEKIQSALDVIS